jgi:Flp pilus assembly protein TadD
LGFVYAARGRLKRAVRALNEVVRLDPSDTDARYRLAWVHQARGEMAEFESQLRGLLEVDNHHALANNDLGCRLAQMGDAQAAQGFLTKGVEADPDNASIRTNLGNTLLMVGENGRARDVFAAACDRQPDAIEALKGLATAERLLGNLDAALIAAEKALALAPGDAASHNLVGTVLKEFGRYDDALRHFGEARSLAEEFAPARANASMIKLLQGDWADGFSEYEARRFDPNIVLPVNRGNRPQWDGSDLAGRSILLLAEQGFGDTIQFCRFAPMLAGAAGKVVFEASPPLRRLLETLAGEIEYVAPGEQPADADVVAPLMSLPHFLHIQSETDVDGEAYLQAGDPPPAAAALLDGASGLKIGLNWRGSPSHKEDWKRSIDPALLQPLLDLDGVTYFSLNVDADAAPPDGVVDLRAHIDDFADTAAIMAALDLVVSVDTSTVHLAGALGRPCWAMIPRVPDWRWMLERDDTPWYASVRLIRQSDIGDWAPVVSEIRSCIEQLRDGA